MRHLTLFSLAFLAAIITVGCADAGDDFETSSLALIDGTPEAEGIIALLNAETTTFETLDIHVGLDRRAALHLITHRDGLDGKRGTQDDNLFDSIEEVDGVWWVGNNALGKLEAFAVNNGWVMLDADAVLGTWDNVTFTVAEAEITLDLANFAGHDELDYDTNLDRRAVDGIFEARPITSIKQLAAVKYVGKSALTKMKARALAYWAD